MGHDVDMWARRSYSNSESPYPHAIWLNVVQEKIHKFFEDVMQATGRFFVRSLSVASPRSAPAYGKTMYAVPPAIIDGGAEPLNETVPPS